MPHIFTYGSLMFAPVWSKVVTGDYRVVPALLKGYIRRAIKGELYPAIIKHEPAETLEGMLYYNIAKEDIKRLDDFEGDYYIRQKQTVFLQNNHAILADIYILKEEYHAILSEQAWDVEHFKTQTIHQFLASF